MTDWKATAAAWQVLTATMQGDTERLAELLSGAEAAFVARELARLLAGAIEDPSMIEFIVAERAREDAEAAELLRRLAEGRPFSTDPGPEL